jgi:predicted enzyme related to lactoylglutathione lyase
MVMLRDMPVSGMARMMADMEAQGVPPHWTTYISTDSADATAKLVADAGGTILAGPMDVPDTGRMFIGRDSAGAVFGVWEPAPFPGSALANEPGAFTWNELMSRDVTRAWDFYSHVFHYGREQMDIGMAEPYTMLKVGDRPVGGMMATPPEVPAEVPSVWMTYFAVDGTDAAVDNARSMGATVLTEPTDSPYGRWSTLQDPQGAVFTVLTAPQDGMPQ